ncbi:hypothetical protein AGDE_14552 [Angomonas deanei]|uniref:Uncharacterized protein n=1 Tax=Angomonas deanei TaxID=59799 RepID=A0A7G2C9C3_9TRYP|nr:hypothetical protein AGDE_14552 [Angomonas deanei]CAD2216450.1 hypothetical protein, conserved [Angomonas deanei]|eukprot:EPY20655.1 hypothetical protein AGDE_14552 [Angomonas deanei]
MVRGHLHHFLLPTKVNGGIKQGTARDGSDTVCTRFNFHSKGDTTITTTCLVQKNVLAGSPNMEFIVGCGVGSVFLLNGGTFAAHLSTVASGVDSSLLTGWGSSRVPNGIELLGYHDQGGCLCSAYYKRLDYGITGGLDGSIYVWNLRGPINLVEETAGEEKTHFACQMRKRKLQFVTRKAHSGPVLSVAIRADKLYSGGGDACLRIWEMRGDTLSVAPLATIRMNGWVRCISTVPDDKTQIEDVFAADSSGLLVCVSSELVPSHPVEGPGVSTSYTRAKSVVRHSKFRFTDVILGEGVTEEICNAVNQVIPIVKHSILVVLNYSPFARVYEFSRLSPVGAITHPFLLGDASAGATPSEYTSRSAPYFVDAFHVEDMDLILLLDNHNLICVVDTSSFKPLHVFRVSESKAKQCFSMIPTAFSVANEEVDFAVVSNVSIDTWHLRRTVRCDVILESHHSPVVGVCQADVKDVVETESARGMGFVALSQDAHLLSWNSGMKLIHEASLDSARSGSTSGFSDAFCMTYCQENNVVLSGHEDGSVVCWPLDMLTIEHQVCKNLHENTVSGIVLLSSCGGWDGEDGAVTIGFDGKLCQWFGLSRHSFALRHRVRVSWNELTCVAYQKETKRFVVGDSGGCVFAVAKDLAVSAVYSPSVTSVLSISGFTCGVCSGTNVLFGNDEGKLLLWNSRFDILHDGKLESSSVPAAEVNGMCHVDGYLFVCSRNGTVYLCKLEESCLTVVKQFHHSSEVTCVCVATFRFPEFQIIIGDGTGKVLLLRNVDFSDTE